MQRYLLPLLTATALSFLFYASMSWIEQVETKFKYKIVTEHVVYHTNSFTKSTDGCIQFLQGDKKQTTVCGNYSIEQTKK